MLNPNPTSSKTTSRWDFYSAIIIASFAFLQIIHWQLFPLFMDIYYHLHAAWGFIQAGGVSSWDFWQYAPFGRTHIYPPVFHLILALFIKLGINQVILAKCLEIFLPVLFLTVVWFFMARNYGKQLALFTLIMASSSFSFFLSLTNHLPATLALIFGFLAIDQLLRRKLLRSVILLTLAFYTHIGVCWFFAVGLIIFALFDKNYRKSSTVVVLLAIILALPILLKQLMDLKFFNAAVLKESYLAEFKTIDYALALFGFWACWKLAGKYRLFNSLFFASLIFLKHQFRFFSAEGFVAIIFLSAVGLNGLFESFKDKKGLVSFLPVIAVVFMLLVSPTILNPKIEVNTRLKVYYFDSAIEGLVFPERNQRVASATLWYPKEYNETVAVIRQSSEPEDIIYCNLDNVGVCLASLSGRATANALLPDILPSKQFTPLAVAKIFIAARTQDPTESAVLINQYGLRKIGENKLFIVYDNPTAQAKISVRKALVPFSVIIFIIAVATFLFCQDKFDLRIKN